MLFKEKYFDGFLKGIAGSIERFSQNSAASIPFILNTVRHNFYKKDLGQLINIIQKNIHSSDFLNILHSFTSQENCTSSNHESIHRLQAHFYHYYFNRLPVLFKCNRVIHRGKKRIPSKIEIEQVIRLCICNYEHSFADLKNPLSPDEYLRFVALSKWYVTAKSKDDAVYSIQWLWDEIKTTYPDVFAGDNIGSITAHTIESCFPMFWDTFRMNYLNSMFYYATLGWFIGDRDIDELEAILLNSKDSHTVPSKSS